MGSKEKISNWNHFGGNLNKAEAAFRHEYYLINHDDDSESGPSLSDFIEWCNQAHHEGRTYVVTLTAEYSYDDSVVVNAANGSDARKTAMRLLEKKLKDEGGLNIRVTGCSEAPKFIDDSSK